jgi:fibronectin-binding autotransporter adhesin
MLVPAFAAAQTVTHVSDDAGLRAALASAVDGDTIVLDSAITLASELPNVGASVTIDGAGHSLSGNNQFRGLFVGALTDDTPLSVNVAIQNLTITNAVAAGGAGGSGSVGGGGGAGMGGALYIANGAIVTVSNVNLTNNSAAGGAGGAGGVVGVDAGGGGGQGGAGGAGAAGAGGGGGGVELGAKGGDASGTGNGGAGGILLGLGGGGNTPPSYVAGGGANAGGGGAGPSTFGGAGGGLNGGTAFGGDGAIGGPGGGGGGGSTSQGGAGGNGGLGGGGGGGINTSGAGFAGFGGGGGGGRGFANGGLLGGAGSTDVAGGGGGGAGLGGAIFMEGGGGLQVIGSFTINGSSASGGASGGGAGAAGGAAFGAGIFLEGSGSLTFNPAADANVTINDAFGDQLGTTGVTDQPSWTLFKGGAGTLTLGGDNKYSGTTFLGQGRLNVGTNANLGLGALFMNDGTTLGISETGAFNKNTFMDGVNTFSVAPGKTATWTGLLHESMYPATLHVAGGGTLALNNAANAFTGGVIVDGNSTVAVTVDAALGASGGALTLGDATSGGTLRIDAPSFTSSRDISLGAGGGTIDTVGNTSALLTGNISGAGGFTKAGSGTLTLGGAFNFLGSISIAGGQLKTLGAGLFGPNSTLNIGAGSSFDFGGFNQNIGAINGDGNLALGGATLVVGANGLNSNFSGAFIGGGSLVKTGGGTMSFLGTPFTGGVTVSGGTLLSNATSLPGNIANDGSVIFDQGVDATYAGTISGSGGFGKSGAGTLTLTGAQTYSGGTLVSGGTLAGNASNIHGVIVDNAAIALAQSANATFNGTLGGSGLFSKSGAGTLTINGSHPFTGLMSVDQGNLTLNGTLGGSASVNQGTFEMNGALGGDLNVGALGNVIGAGLINGSTTLAGGLTIPALQSDLASFARERFHTMATSTAPAPQLIVNGDFNALPGSNLTFTVVRDGVAPILVNGRATLQGTNINVTIDDPDPARYSTYTALTAAQGLTAAGLTVTNNGPIVPVLKVEPNNLLVTLLNYNIPLGGVVTGTNATSVGKAVDKLRNGATGDLAFISHELTALTDTQLDAALKSLSGEVHASQARIVATDSQSVTDIIRTAISDREDDAKAAKDEAKNGGAVVKRSRISPMWVQLAADHANLADGSIANTGGGAGGYDIRQTDNFTVGAGISFTQGTLTLGDGGGISQMTAPRAFGYTGVGFGPFKLHGGGSAARTKNKTERGIAFQAMVPNENGQLVPLSDGVDRTAQSDQTGVAADGWTEIKAGQTVKDWNFDYKSSVRTSRVTRHAFAEQGAGAISLEGGDETITIKEADVNVASARKSGKWRPHFLLEYRKEFAPTATTANLNFEGRPDASFETEGLPIPQTEYKGLAGITMHGSFLEYTIEYHFAKSQGEKHQSLSVRLHFR